MQKKKTPIIGALFIIMFYSICIHATAAVPPLLNPATAPGNSDPVGDEWPMFHGALNHTGTVDTTPVQASGALWTYAMGFNGRSSPSEINDRVYTPGGPNYLNMYCLNATSGAIIWSRDIGGSESSSPAIADDRVYVGSIDGKVYCLNVIDGAFIWSYTTGASVRSSPAVSSGHVFVGSDDKKIYCLNATTGALAWSNSTGGIILSSPAVASGHVYVGSGDNTLYCFDVTTGDVAWTFVTSGAIYSSPAVSGGRVYVGSWDDHLYCLDSTSGTLIWSFATGGGVGSSPAIADGRVYVGSIDHEIYCLNATTGFLSWSYTTDDFVWSSPAVANGLVYIGSADGNVYCLNAISGTNMWTYSTGSLVNSSPALARGHVYVSSDDGKLYCLPMRMISSLPNPGWTAIQIIVFLSAIVAFLAILIKYRAKIRDYIRKPARDLELTEELNQIKEELDDTGFRRTRIAEISILASLGNAISLLYNALNPLDVAGYAPLFSWLSIVFIVCLILSWILFRYKKIKSLVVIRSIVATLAITSLIYFIAFYLYPLPVLRYSYDVVDAGILSLLYPGSTPIVKFPAAGIIWQGNTYSWFFTVACAHPETWALFTSIIWFFPGLSVKSKLKKGAAMFFLDQAVYVITVTVEQILFIDMQIDWTTVHLGVVSSMINIAIGITWRFVTFYVMLPDVRKFCNAIIQRLKNKVARFSVPNKNAG